MSWSSASLAMFASTARNGAADAAISLPMACGSPPVSRKPSRRCTRWLLAASADAREDIAAGDDFVVGDDVAVCEREHVQRAKKLLAFEDERNGERGAAPVR